MRNMWHMCIHMWARVHAPVYGLWVLCIIRESVCLRHACVQMHGVHVWHSNMQGWMSTCMHTRANVHLCRSECILMCGHAKVQGSRIHGHGHGHGCVYHAYMGRVGAVFIQSSWMHAGTFLNTKCVVIRIKCQLWKMKISKVPNRCSPPHPRGSKHKKPRQVGGVRYLSSFHSPIFFFNTQIQYLIF